MVSRLLPNETEVRAVHSLKARDAMLFTLPGMVTEAREVQPANTLLSSLVTPFGMVISARDAH